MVPVRFIAESFGETVNWNGDTKTVEITSDYLKEVAVSEKLAHLDSRFHRPIPREFTKSSELGDWIYFEGDNSAVTKNDDLSLFGQATDLVSYDEFLNGGGFDKGNAQETSYGKKEVVDINEEGIFKSVRKIDSINILEGDPSENAYSIMINSTKRDRDINNKDLNNYVKFADLNFQIIKINSDNTIRMILVDDIKNTVWDDRYNNKTGSAVGKNDFTISRIREQLDKYFKDTEIFNENMKKLIVPQDLCIGARSETSTINDGSLECAKKLEKQPIGLLQVNEYMLATIESTCKHLFDNQCTNYNYLANIRNTWTLTPNSGNTYEVYRVSKFVYSNDANDTSQPRFVITISSDALFDKGSGTEEDPYIMKEN